MSGTVFLNLRRLQSCFYVMRADCILFKGNSKINNNTPSKMHHWPYICMGILPPQLVHNHGCVSSLYRGSSFWLWPCRKVFAALCDNCWKASQLYGRVSFYLFLMYFSACLYHLYTAVHTGSLVFGSKHVDSWSPVFESCLDVQVIGSSTFINVNEPLRKVGLPGKVGRT